MDGISIAHNDKKKSIMEFRNVSYRSVLTGTMAPPHHTSWKEALDDSYEAYLADGTVIPEEGEVD